MLDIERQAVVLAGGKGTRLRPYTVVLPKPLMPIGEYPILEIIIRQLRRYGFRMITIAVNHQAELIKAFFGDGTKWGIHIRYSLEDRPLSTMGPLGLIPDLPNHFLVMNGDVLTDLDFGRFLDNHRSHGGLFSIAAYRRQQTADYGVLSVDPKGFLEHFEEKPTSSYLVSMGVYAVSCQIADTIPRGQAYGFDNLMLDMLHRRQEVRVIEHRGEWLDIGRPDDYQQAIDTYEALKSRLLPNE